MIPDPPVWKSERGNGFSIEFPKMTDWNKEMSTFGTETSQTMMIRDTLIK